MTQREKKLVVFTVSVIVLWSGILFFLNINQNRNDGNRVAQPVNATNYGEIQSLLRSSRNIMARDQQMAARLTELRGRFLPSDDLSQAQLKFLEEIEQIAFRSNLTVEQKNTIRYSDAAIGVALAGKASAAAVVTFLQQTTAAPVGIVIQRLQLHSLPDERQLEYNITASTLWVTQHGK